MDSVVLAVRLVLAAVFLVAAVGKFIDLPSSRRSLVGFGVPEGLASVAGTVLPVAELAVAIALVPKPSAQWGAICALVLLLAFVVGLANALRKGEAPPCNCFGAIHSEPASPKTLARNIALAALAAIGIGWGPGPTVDGWVADRTAAELVAVLLGTALIAALLLGIPLWLESRRLRTKLKKAEDRLAKMPPGLPVGSPAPPFSTPDGEGGTVTLSSLLARGKPVILVFASAGCGPCEPMLPDLRRLQSIAADQVTVALVGISTIQRYDAAREARGDDYMLNEAIVEDPVLKQEMDDLLEIAHLYEVHHSPAALLVTASGTIGSAPVEARRGIEALIRLAIAEATPHANGNILKLSAPAA